MSSRKKKKRSSANDNHNDNDNEASLLLASMPISQAAWKQDDEALTNCLRPLLSTENGHELSVVHLKQNLGERFTGGRSTPVYEIVLRENRPHGETHKDHHLILKMVIQLAPPDSATTQYSTYAIRVRSYEVEAGFYGWNDDGPNPAKALRKLGLVLPTLLAVEKGGAHDTTMQQQASTTGASAIAFFMLNLCVTHPIHPESLTTRQTRAALDWLATLHARFWEAPKLSTNEWAGSRLWECGSYWAIPYRVQLCNSAQADQQTDNMESLWVKTLKWMQKKSPDVASLPSIKLMGSRLAAARRGLHCALHYGGDSKQMLSEPFNLSPVVYHKASNSNKRAYIPQRHRTLIHGDFKAANMFFTDNDQDESAKACAVCDFQFTGPGFGAVDVCNLLFPDARTDYRHVELELLDWYYDQLEKHMETLGKELASYSKETLVLHYSLVQVDLLAHLINRGWVASAERDTGLIMQADETLTKLDSGEVLTMDEYEAAIRRYLAQI